MRQDKVVGAKYVLLEELEPWGDVADILELVEDDGTSCPKFLNLSKGGELFQRMGCVAMLADDLPEVTELPEHKYAIGQKLTVNSNMDIWHQYDTGTEVTVIGLEGFFGDINENGIPKYEVRKVGSDLAQYLLETQLDAVVTPHKFAVGDSVKIVATDKEESWETVAEGTLATVTALEFSGGRTHYAGDLAGVPAYRVRTGNGNVQSVTEYQLEAVLSHITDEEFSQLEAGDKFVVRPDLEAGDDYGLWVNPLMMKNAGETLTVKAVHFGYRVGTVEDCYYYTADMIAEVIKKPKLQWDNPEVKAGDVIVRKHVRNRGETVINRVNRNDDTDFYFFSYLFDSGSFVRSGHQSGVKNWRKATPEEVAELEDAEKKHGVKLPLINNKGTVIEAGSYYVLNADYGHKVIVKVTSVCLSTETFAKSVVSVNLYGEVLGEYPHTTLGSPYGVSAVPATPEQIELYDTAVAFHKAKEQLSA